MSKRILVTSGPVFGKLDDNKIFSNLARGKWALQFEDYMKRRGHFVWSVHNMEWRAYLESCINLAKVSDAAVMAAAVVNYVPEKPFEGKMPTDMDEVTVKLVRTPYVIDEIRKVNPKCKLIGCKLTSREEKDSTVAKAQQLMDRSKAHAVIANDRDNLKLKMLCFPDGAVVQFDNLFDKLYAELQAMVEDIHFRTECGNLERHEDESSRVLMDKLLKRYSGSFTKPWAGETRKFGSIAVRRSDGLMIATPRKKPAAEDLTSKHCPCVLVANEVFSVKTSGEKATMNAPLLWDVLQQHREAAAVVHLHEFLGGNFVQTFPYAPAGTARDSLRGDLPKKFNIQNHGFVACVGKDGNFL